MQVSLHWKVYQIGVGWWNPNEVVNVNIHFINFAAVYTACKYIRCIMQFSLASICLAFTSFKSQLFNLQVIHKTKSFYLFPFVKCYARSLWIVFKLDRYVILKWHYCHGIVHSLHLLNTIAISKVQQEVCICINYKVL